MKRIPLRHRAPNPSATFFGRDQELERLGELFERGPLAVLVGPGGIGKTELALRAVPTLFPERQQRALLFRIPPESSPDQVRIDLARMMVEASGDESVDIAALRGDPEELVALAIDLAEAGGFFVMVDDLHHSDEDEMRELVAQIGAYARSARWLCTTRSLRPMPGLEGRMLELDMLDDATLYRLAASLSTSEDDVAGAVAAAQGSPWLLKQFAAAGAEGVSTSRAGVLATLEAPEFLRVLASMHEAITPSVLAQVIALPDDSCLEAMERRGLLYRRSGRFVAHDLVRSFLFPPDARTPTRELELGGALADIDDPDAQLEALRLFRKHGDTPAMVAMLDASGDELFAYGRAPAIWKLLVDSHDEQLDLWRLRSAVELGNSTVLARVREPAAANSDRLPWAATQYLLGQPSEALRTLEGARDVASRVLAARCELSLGKLDSAMERLATSQESAEASALLCHVQALSRTLTREHLADWLRVHHRAAPEALLDIAHALYQLADLEGADTLLDRVLASPRGRRRLLVGRRALLLRARIRLAAGRLDETGQTLESVRPFARGMSILRPELVELDGQWRVAMGRVDGLDVQLEHAAEIAQDTDLRVHALLNHIRLRVEVLLRGDAVDATPNSWTRWLPPPMADAWQRILQPTESRADALDFHRSTIARCHAAGLVLLACEAQLAFGDALLAAGQDEDIDACAEELSELAERTGSPRLMGRARFLRERHRIESLEFFASGGGDAPVAQRRARELLDGTCDEPCMWRVAGYWSKFDLQTLCAHEGVRWGLHMDEQRVWTQRGQSYELARTALLWRILETLAQHDGYASKEMLIEQAWGESAYHPLRHDSKLHVSIRKLRNAIDDEDRTMLVTEEDGYRLGGTVRILRRRTPS